MNMPTVYLQEAIETHEHMHVQQIRNEHFGISTYAWVGHKESREKKTSAVLQEFIRDYADTLHNRIQKEFEVLNKLELAYVERPIEVGALNVKVNPFE